MPRNYKRKQRVEVPDLEGEVWVEAFEFPNYLVSNMGRVKNYKRGTLVKLLDDGQGYYLVSLYHNGKRHMKRVARLVYTSFNDCGCGLTIDHINKDKKDNRVHNLRCVTQKENSDNRDAIKIKNKYNLTNELRGLIASKLQSGEWTTWTIYKQFGIPMKYSRNVRKRGSWLKHIKK